MPTKATLPTVSFVRPQDTNRIYGRFGLVPWEDLSFLVTLPQRERLTASTT